MTRIRQEDGWTLITGVMLMTVMLAMAMATFSFVDTQQQQSGDSRKRETAFNVAEATLNAQMFALSRDWPGAGMAPDKSNNPYPVCTQAGTGTRCPTAATLSELFASPDTAVGLTWQTEVHDNNAPNPYFYSEATTRTAPAYDANDDGKVWVRAQAIARGKARTMIGLVRVQTQEEEVPHITLLAGSLEISNNGGHGGRAIINATGGASQNLPQVRCTPTLLELVPCLGHPLSLLGADLSWFIKKPQIQPLPSLDNTGYSLGNAMSVEARARLKTRAIADGRYYTSCPTATQLAGPVVWIESGNCSYTGNDVVNSPAKPGIVLMNSGTLQFGGKLTFHGVIYGINPLNLGGTMVSVHANAEIHGGVLVDGNGRLVAGSNAWTNIKFVAGAFNAARSYGSAGIIQNTFREIKGA
jgi:hypothetical protein